MGALFENAYVLNVLSDDHPGIIAAVGEMVTALGGNIDACSQTVLGGYFTLIMVVSFPDAVAPDDLAANIACQDTCGSKLQVLVRRLEPPRFAGSAGLTERFVVTASGQDRPGIVLRFSQYLAGKDINIVDLYGDRMGDEFVLIGQVEIPARQNLAMLQTDLEEMGRELGFTVRLQHEGIFVATNQLRLRRP